MYKTFELPVSKQPLMKFILPLILLLCISFSSRGQYSSYDDKAVTLEAGVSIGPMNSLTDIGGRRGRGTRGPKDMNLKSTTFYGSVYGSAIYKHFLAVRTEISVGSIKSHDSLLADIKNTAIGRYNRNLSFRSDIQEITFTLEFHPIDFFSNFNPQRFPAALSPYLIWGFGYFHFNPQANLNGVWIDLRPLHTEGEGFAEYPDRKEYKLYQFNMPVGVGIAYELSPKFNLRLEYMHRKSFTDYLDDAHDTYIDPALFSKYLSGIDLNNALSLNNRGRTNVDPRLTTARPGGRRANPLNNDSYFTVNFKIGYAFGRENSSSGAVGRSRGKNAKRQLQCPRLF